MDKVPLQRILQLRVPIQFHRAGDMADVVQQDIFSRLDDPHVWIVEMSRNPVRGYEHVRAGVLLNLLLKISHVSLPTVYHILGIWSAADNRLWDDSGIRRCRCRRCLSLEAA